MFPSKLRTKHFQKSEKCRWKTFNFLYFHFHLSFHIFYSSRHGKPQLYFLPSPFPSLESFSIISMCNKKLPQTTDQHSTTWNLSLQRAATMALRCKWGKVGQCGGGSEEVEGKAKLTLNWLHTKFKVNFLLFIFRSGTFFLSSLAGKWKEKFLCSTRQIPPR